MSIRTTALCIALALSVPGLSLARSYVEVDVAPPEVRYEEVPAARVGYVWAPGYWEWHHREHVWVKGRYIRERHGYHWVGARWNHEGERYRFEVGHWDRD
jgi:hypothetical protein